MRLVILFVIIFRFVPVIVLVSGNNAGKWIFFAVLPSIGVNSFSILTYPVLQHRKSYSF
jgi:hypothetical protein